MTEYFSKSKQLRRRALLLAAVAALYLHLSLQPYTWNPPRAVANGAQAVAGEALRFDAPGIALGSNAWVPRAIQQQEFALELLLRAFPGNSSAVIFTSSPDLSCCNIRLRVEHDDLVVRIRTPRTALAGEDVARLTGLFSQTGVWRRIKIEVRESTLQVSAGDKRVRVPIGNDPLKTWSRRYPVAFGNEPTGNVPWLGEIATAEVWVGERVTRYVQGKELDIPAKYWHYYMRPRLIPFSDWDIRGNWQDYVLNLVGYVPLGLYLAVFLVTNWRAACAILFCVLVSTVAEATQLCFERFVSATDLVLNGLGGAIGAAIPRLLKKHAIGW